MYVNTLPQCSPASVGLAQARPNHPASPRSELSQVAVGQPGTSRDIPLPNTTLPVPGPSCPKLPWDNPRTSRDIPLPNTTLPIPGPSCPKLPWDNPGHPGTSHYLTPPCQSQVRVVSSCHGTTQDIPGTSHYLRPPCQSQVRVVSSCHGTTPDIRGTSHYLRSPCQSQVQKKQQLRHEQ